MKFGNGVTVHMRKEYILLFFYLHVINIFGERVISFLPQNVNVNLHLLSDHCINVMGVGLSTFKVTHS